MATMDPLPCGDALAEAQLDKVTGDVETPVDNHDPVPAEADDAVPAEPDDAVPAEADDVILTEADDAILAEADDAGPGFLHT